MTAAEVAQGVPAVSVPAGAQMVSASASQNAVIRDPQLDGNTSSSISSSGAVRSLTRRTILSGRRLGMERTADA